jgi:sugar lactone lactonase YvrE
MAASSVVVSPPALFGTHRSRLGESPVWDAAQNRLLWCDIEGKEILAASTDGDVIRRWALPDKIGSFGLCESGRWVLGLRKGVHLFDPESERLSLLVEPGPEPASTRLNDGKVGPDGAFWVGTMDDRPDRQPIGSLYRVTADGKAEKKVEGMTVPNGLAWSSDGRTLFHSDSRGRWIDAYDFDAATGAMRNKRRIVADITEEQGRPDGGACDLGGAYWSAGVSAQCLHRYSATGDLLETVVMPMPACTMPCFGGTDMKTLYVTSLSEGLKGARALNPNIGRLAVLKLSVAGAPVAKFRDR